MKVTVQVVLHADDDTQMVVREAFTLIGEALAPDTLGLQLQEAKDLLAAVQDTLVEHQVNTALSAQIACPDCGIPRRHKDSRLIVMRTLFGTLRTARPAHQHQPPDLHGRPVLPAPQTPRPRRLDTTPGRRVDLTNQAPPGELREHHPWGIT